MQYKYNGTVATVLYFNDDLQTISPGDVVDLVTPPSSQFSLVYKEAKAPPVKKQKKNTPSIPKTSEITNASNTKTSPIRE